MYSSAKQYCEFETPKIFSLVDGKIIGMNTLFEAAEIIKEEVESQGVYVPKYHNTQNFAEWVKDIEERLNDKI